MLILEGSFQRHFAPDTILELQPETMLYRKLIGRSVSFPGAPSAGDVSIVEHLIMDAIHHFAVERKTRGTIYERMYTTPPLDRDMWPLFYMA